MNKQYRIIDLSRELIPEKERFKLSIKTFFADEYIAEGINRKKDDWYIIQDITACSHIGTHIESPFHHIKEGQDCSEIPLEKVVGEALVLNFSYKKPNESIELEEVEEKEKLIKKRDIVLLKEGWSKYYNTSMYKRRPHLTLEAARYLVDRGIKCIGVDASGIENNEDIEQPVHRLFFEHEIPIIEDLQNLESIENERVFLIALSWRVKGLDSSPTRVIAFEKFGNEEGWNF